MKPGLTMRTIVIVICVLLAACEGGPITPEQPPAASATLTGHVFDATTREALGGANIYILQGVNYGRFAVADAGGKFTLPDLTTGTFTIEVLTIAYNATIRELTLSGDTTLDFPLTKRVIPTFLVTGRVSDTSGAPLGGALVTVLDGPSAGRETTSGQDGTFRLPDVLFGGCTIRVRKDGYDSVFEGVRVTEDMSLDVQLRREQETLAGVWAGDLVYATGVKEVITELRITHSGATIEGNYSAGTFKGILENPSTIAEGTDITGTLELRLWTGGRNPQPCHGTGNFSGTVNWTRLVITAPKITYACGGEASVTMSLVRQH